MKKENLFYLLITLVSFAVVYLTKNSEFMSLIELKTIDLRATSKSAITHYKDKTVIIGISDSCIKKITAWPFPRAWYGYLTHWLAKGKIKGIMFDLIFSGPSPFSMKDQQNFEKSIKKSAQITSVIIGCDLGLREIMDPETWETKTVLDFENTHDLDPAVKGSVNMGNLQYMNPDSILRFVPLVYKSKDRVFPSLATALFIKSKGLENTVLEYKKNSIHIKGNLPDKSNYIYKIPGLIRGMSGGKPSDDNSVVAYTLLSRSQYLKDAEYFEIVDLLPGALNHWAVRGLTEQNNNIDIKKFKQIFKKALELAEKTENKYHIKIIKNNIHFADQGKFDKLENIQVPDSFIDSLVTVMGTGTGLFDLYPSSIDGTKIPGGWIHSSLLRQLNFKENCKIYTSAILPSLILCLLVFLALRVKNNIFSFVFFSSIIGAFIFIAWMLFYKNYLINVSQPLFISFLSYGAGTLLKLFIFQKRTRELKNIFSKYVSPEVAGKIIDEKDNISLKGTYYDASVLFLDVCGFTSYSEQNTPEKVFMTLNEYFDFITEIIFENYGTLDKFIGDAAMAVFGVPVICKNHAEQSLLAAIEIQKRIFEFNRCNIEKGFNLTVSIGIATGKMVAGNIGSKKRMDYTVIGDTVNLSARLEAKAGSGEIILSEATWKSINDDCQVKKDHHGLIKNLAPFSVKGKKLPVKAYSLDMNPEDTKACLNGQQ